jgi:hypothetical protein
MHAQKRRICCFSQAPRILHPQLRLGFARSARNFLFLAVVCEFVSSKRRGGVTERYLIAKLGQLVESVCACGSCRSNLRGGAPNSEVQAFNFEVWAVRQSGADGARAVQGRRLIWQGERGLLLVFQHSVVIGACCCYCSSSLILFLFITAGRYGVPSLSFH